MTEWVFVVCAAVALPWVLLWEAPHAGRWDAGHGCALHVRARHVVSGKERALRHQLGNVSSSVALLGNCRVKLAAE